MSEEVVNDGKIKCELDGARVHSIQMHLKEHYPSMTLAEYQAKFPGAPVLSPLAEKTVRQKAAAKKAMTVVGGGRQPFHEVFGLGGAKAAFNGAGNPIPIVVLAPDTELGRSLVPEIDDNYVFDIDLVKTILIAYELGTPCYLWGYHGTGKTTCFEQVSARVKRPFMRVQHTVNTEETHIVGQYVVQRGETVFQPGPLMVAMREGFVYCADEYDYAMPSVLSVYQPILEGKALFVKEAPPEFQITRPHPNFRFVATGNTNGVGDETGLYQGTQIQNAANYSRFGVTVQVHYMEPKVEEAVVAGQANIDKAAAAKIVDFAGRIRDQFKAGKIGIPIGPRELINAARFAAMRGGAWRDGLKVAYIARMSRVDAETADALAQRIFG